MSRLEDLKKQVETARQARYVAQESFFVAEMALRDEERRIDEEIKAQEAAKAAEALKAQEEARKEAVKRALERAEKEDREALEACRDKELPAARAASEEMARYVEEDPARAAQALFLLSSILTTAMPDPNDVRWALDLHLYDEDVRVLAVHDTSRATAVLDSLPACPSLDLALQVLANDSRPLAFRREEKAFYPALKRRRV